MSRLISKLRLREESIDRQAGVQLAMALCRNGQLLPREQQVFISDWTFSQAAILIMKLARLVPSGQERDELARRIVKEAEPPAFAFECLRWLRKDADQPEENRVIATETEEQIGNILAERVRSEAKKSPLYRSHGTDAPRLFWIWNKYAQDREVESYLVRRFETDPAEIDDFLSVYAGRAWGMESGLSRVADFSRDNFDAVENLISPEFIFLKLKERYGAELDTPRYHHAEEVPVARRIAHQFASIYQGIKKEAESKKTGAKKTPET